VFSTVTDDYQLGTELPSGPLIRQSLAVKCLPAGTQVFQFIRHEIWNRDRDNFVSDRRTQLRNVPFCCFLALRESVLDTARVEMLFQHHTPLGQRFWDRLRLAQSSLSASYPVYQQHETKTYNLTRDEILFKSRICLPFK